MDTPKVSQMWDALQKANRLPNSENLSGAEEELHELMRQIDIMVQTRKGEWEREKHSLMGRLDIREQEYTSQKITLDQRHQEVGQLRSQLSSAEESQRTSAQEYEKQLIGLREEVTETSKLEAAHLLSSFVNGDDLEVANMKKEYEKLHRRYSKQAKEAQRDKNKVTTNAEESTAEIRRLSAKLEDYRKRSKDWDQKRRDYEKQIEGLEAQKQSLQEKCHLSEQHKVCYQNQMTKRKDVLDSAEVDMKTQLNHLEGQIDRAKETIATQDSQNSRLKTSLEEALAAQRKTLEEKGVVEADVHRNHTTFKVLEEKLKKSQLHLDAQEKKVFLMQEEEEKLHQEIRKQEKRVREKDSIIQQIQTNTVKEQLDQVKKLETSLLSARAELRNFQKSEQRSQEEIKSLQLKLEESRLENVNLNSEITTKITEIASSEKSSLNNFKVELSKILSDHRVQEEAHRGEVEGMKREMAAVTTELHDRNVAMATLSEKMAALERQGREHYEILERKQAELQVTHAQLDALRLENRHLCRSAMSLGGATDCDIAEAEKHLRELQKAYTSSVASLESQNARLQEDIKLVKSQLNTAEESMDCRLQRALQESQRTVLDLKQEEERRLSEQQEVSERRVRFLEDKLAHTVERYETQLESLQLEMTQMGEELDIQNKSMQRLGMEHTVMSNFVDGVDKIVQSPKRQPYPSNRHHGDSQSNPSADISVEMDDEIEDDFLTDTAEAATAQFLQDQELRTQDLEDQLNAHIQYLRSKTDSTVQQYITAH